MLGTHSEPRRGQMSHICGSECVSVKPEIVWRESTAFELILRSAWGLSSPGKQVGRSNTPCRKRSQVWDRESERWPKYMQQRRQC